MKIIYMGTPLFAVPSLERLVESSHKVALVVTQPDRKVGRGQKMQAPPVKKFAEEKGIEVIQPKSIRTDEFLETIKDIAPDAIVVAAYGKILPESVLEAPRLGCINVHASLLPRYRGAAPVNWAIINGETETGVTIMKMDKGMDTGDIIARESTEILEDDDAQSVTQMLSVLGADLLVKCLDKIEQDDAIESRPQDDSQATYAPMLSKEDGEIDWSQSTEKIICRVRGVYPWPGAYTTRNGENLKIRRVEPVWHTLAEEIEKPEQYEPGTVIYLDKAQGFVVKTGDGLVMVTEAQPPGKRALSGRDMINGKLIAKGDKLGAPTPPE
ncbi:MAG: methionyl-tRNA formyltransferase [Candidatus Sumerlaeia bacterium]